MHTLFHKYPVCTKVAGTLNHFFSFWCVWSIKPGEGFSRVCNKLWFDRPYISLNTSKHSPNGPLWILPSLWSFVCVCVCVYCKQMCNNRAHSHHELLLKKRKKWLFQLPSESQFEIVGFTVQHIWYMTGLWSVICNISNKSHWVSPLKAVTPRLLDDDITDYGEFLASRVLYCTFMTRYDASL